MGILSYIALHYVYAAFVVTTLDAYMRVKVYGVRALSLRVLWSCVKTLVYWPVVVRCWVSILTGLLRRAMLKGLEPF